MLLAVESQRLKNASDLAEIRARQAELKARETATLARERVVITRENAQHNTDHQFQDLAGEGTCHICHANLTNYGRQAIVNHFRQMHGKYSSAGAPAPSRATAADTGAAIGNCPFPGCYDDLDKLCKTGLRNHMQQHANEMLANYHQHGEKIDGLPACHSAALNASLAEFKRRLPDFRDAHAILQKMVDASGTAGTQPAKQPVRQAPSYSAERQKQEQEWKEITQLENRLG